MSADSLVGLWLLTDWTQTYRDGRIERPMGRDPVGRLVYTPEGTMLGMVSAADRAPFTTGGQWTASAEERARAYSGFLAYSGRYTVEGDYVTHHVDLSLFPNWVGAEQRRRIERGGDQLHLTGVIEPGTDHEREARLSWVRAGYPHDSQ